ncbi:porin [Paraburkholderia bryophila]|uniref:porin n=1 Tax=Paraburkholderia bryophila TaxID=420952 RepID=UPI0027B9A8DC|nr:porin [Paraburkholderia bryophila]
MKKKTLVSGAMMLACAGAHAQSSVWLSGYVDLNIEHLISSGSGGNVTRMSSGGLNNSRFNLSGVEDLGGGNKGRVHRRTDVLREQRRAVDAVPSIVRRSQGQLG